MESANDCQLEAQLKLEYEDLRIDEIPHASSRTVQTYKRHLVGDVDLPSIMDGFKKISTCLRVAYFGTVASRERCLQQKVQDVMYTVTELCQQSNHALGTFSRRCADICRELVNGFKYLIEGFDDMTLINLQKVADVVNEMIELSAKLKEAFDEGVEDVKKVLNDVQREETVQETLNLQDEDKRRQLQEDIKINEVDLSHYDEMASFATTDYNLRSQQLNDLKQKPSLMVELLQMMKDFFRLHEPDFPMVSLEKEIYAAREQKREYTKKKVEADQEIRRSEGTLRMLDHKIQVREHAITALHGAVTGMKELSDIMLKTECFWKSLSEINDRMMKEGLSLKEKVATGVACESARRCKVWQSETFKSEAVSNMALWVAFGDICSSNREDMKKAMNDLHELLRENPTITEAITELKVMSASAERISGHEDNDPQDGAGSSGRAEAANPIEQEQHAVASQANEEICIKSSDNTLHETSFAVKFKASTQNDSKRLAKPLYYKMLMSQSQQQTTKATALNPGHTHTQNSAKGARRNRNHDRAIMTMTEHPTTPNFTKSELSKTEQNRATTLNPEHRPSQNSSKRAMRNTEQERATTMSHEYPPTQNPTRRAQSNPNHDRANTKNPDHPPTHNQTKREVRLTEQDRATTLNPEPTHNSAIRAVSNTKQDKATTLNPGHPLTQNSTTRAVRNTELDRATTLNPEPTQNTTRRDMSNYAKQDKATTLNPEHPLTQNSTEGAVRSTDYDRTPTLNPGLPIQDSLEVKPLIPTPKNLNDVQGKTDISPALSRQPPRSDIHRDVEESVRKPQQPNDSPSKQSISNGIEQQQFKAQNLQLSRAGTIKNIPKSFRPTVAAKPEFLSTRRRILTNDECRPLCLDKACQEPTGDGQHDVLKCIQKQPIDMPARPAQQTSTADRDHNTAVVMTPGDTSTLDSVGKALACGDHCTEKGITGTQKRSNDVVRGEPNNPHLQALEPSVYRRSNDVIDKLLDPKQKPSRDGVCGKGDSSSTLASTCTSPKFDDHPVVLESITEPLQPNDTSSRQCVTIGREQELPKDQNFKPANVETTKDTTKSLRPPIALKPVFLSSRDKILKNVDACRKAYPDHDEAGLPLETNPSNQVQSSVAHPPQSDPQMTQPSTNVIQTKQTTDPSVEIPKQNLKLETSEEKRCNVAKRFGAYNLPSDVINEFSVELARNQVNNSTEMVTDVRQLTTKSKMLKMDGIKTVGKLRTPPVLSNSIAGPIKEPKGVKTCKNEEQSPTPTPKISAAQMIQQPPSVGNQSGKHCDITQGLAKGGNSKTKPPPNPKSKMIKNLISKFQG